MLIFVITDIITQILHDYYFFDYFKSPSYLQKVGKLSQAVRSGLLKGTASMRM